jgi:hypothetical protein
MTIRKRQLLGVAFACLAAGAGSMCGASQAPDQTTGLAVLGPGWAECAEVNDEVSGDGNIRSMFTAWLQGYITARNDAGPRKNTGADASPYALIDAALAYCSDNPGSRFSDATRNVYERLIQDSQSAR